MKVKVNMGNNMGKWNGWMNNPIAGSCPQTSLPDPSGRPCFSGGRGGCRTIFRVLPPWGDKIEPPPPGPPTHEECYTHVVTA